MLIDQLDQFVVHGISPVAAVLPNGMSDTPSAERDTRFSNPYRLPKEFRTSAAMLLARRLPPKWFFFGKLSQRRARRIIHQIDQTPAPNSLLQPMMKAAVHLQ
jgi:hypothetical protein